MTAFRKHSLNPERPIMRGSHENGDIFFQHREACNKYYEDLPEVVEKYMGKINEKLGTNYQLFNYYGAPDADRVIIAMGSICDVAEEVIDYMNAHGEKVGLVKVRLYPSVPRRSSLLGCHPRYRARRSAVLDRTKEPGSQGEPLYQDVVTALANAGRMTDIKVIGGRYGLGSKDTPPASVFAVYDELKKDEPKREFTIGIVDDVTHLSLEEKAAPSVAPAGTIECKFWGLGGDGTVGANKNSIKIIGDHTDKYVQAYFQYDSKKTGGVTVSHLRFGDQPIKSSVLYQQGRLRGLPRARLHHQGLPHRPRREARRRVPDQLPVGATRSSATIWMPLPSATSPRTTSRSTPSTPSTWPSRSAWASAPTPSCSPPSSLWPRSCLRARPCST